jgi:(p)ppGpp synthase/HD superfamily hydrolase
MPTIGETIDHIRLLHAGQLTKAGEPYWTHPVAVMCLLPADATDDERIAALLHDVIEDCGCSAGMLRDSGYSHRTVDLVQALSRPVGANRPTYSEWIASIIASGDRGLMQIKLADNRHNSMPDRIAALPPSERSIVKRYETSQAALRAALAAI